MILLKLFLSFLKIGAFTFGGGYAMIPLMKKEIITNHEWLTLDEFVDILGIAEMTPGPIAINSATFLGYKVAGVLGSVVSTIAVVLPSFIVIIVIYHFLNKFKDSPYVDWAFRGIRPVVLGLIAAASITVAMDVFVDYKSFIIAGLVFYLVSFKKISPIICILIAGGLGLLFYM
jgi:chromate transporter